MSQPVVGLHSNRFGRRQLRGGIHRRRLGGRASGKGKGEQTGQGKAERGKALFSDLKGLACIKCHSVGKQGGTVGPELSSVGAKYQRGEIIESVLYPSAKIFTGYEPNVVGSNDYAETAGSSVVVITAGLPRGPGMSRDDLVTTNEKIVKDVTGKVIGESPGAILIVVSNPLDAMCHVARSVSGWPRERVVGMAGILDTARFATFIAWETGSSVKDVTAPVSVAMPAVSMPSRAHSARRNAPCSSSPTAPIIPMGKAAPSMRRSTAILSPGPPVLRETCSMVAK